MRERKRRIIDDLQEHVRFLGELGVDFIGVLPESGNAPQSRNALQDLVEKILVCEKCPLALSRTQAVPGEGSNQADLMFVGEGPGHEEDIQGRPFVGKAGQLLTKIIHAMELSRDDVYITNIVKCRPPGNRNPHLDEISRCAPFLQQQLRLIKPRIIVSLGNVPTKHLLETSSGISALRGQFHTYGDIQIMPTFHPSFLLRNEQNREPRRKVWEDMKKVMAALGRK